MELHFLKESLGKTIPILILIMCLSITFIFWYNVQKEIKNLEEEKFNYLVDEIERDINSALGGYLSTLFFIEGYYGSSEKIEEAEWAKYVSKVRRIDSMDTIKYIGYAEFENCNQDTSEYSNALEYISLQESIVSNNTSSNNMSISSNNISLKVKYVQPEGSGKKFIGIDIMEDSFRKSMILESISKKEAVLVGPINPLVEESLFYDFVIYLPLFKNSDKSKSPCAIAIMAFDSRAIVRNIFLDNSSSFDEYITGMVIDYSDEHYLLMQNSKNIEKNDPLTNMDIELYADTIIFFDTLTNVTEEMRGKYSETRVFTVLNQEWTLKISSLKDFRIDPIRNSLPTIILVIGMLFSILIFILVASLANMTQTANSIASEMTKNLLESTKKLHEQDRIISISPTIFFRTRLDYDFTIDFISDNISQLGYDSKDIMDGKIAFLSVCDHEDVERLRIEIDETLKKGLGEFVTSMRLKTPKGIIWVEAHAYVIRDDKGVATSLQGFIIDITSRKNAQDTAESKSKEIETMNSFMVGRELRMADLKKDNDRLRKENENLKKRL
ncbi:MAG: CHASE domain-containing protein [Candidatus Woesearchaeota archaeon]